ncbi:MAG: hypothetical protein A3F80_02055 [Candidatus Melainabacteria bacterium RIFCSPLOWO2_12_FULL_35_11]|nr:MAG: hypothetical protein A3F80_02055 [Candidatus Melainabacteria bacterium RIFCSPLOWO2_12_FULL_35_11]
MNKVNRVISNNSVRTIDYGSKNNDEAEELTRSVEVTTFQGNNLDLEPDSELASSKLFLRDKVIAAQRLKRELGIENQAAIEPFSLIAIASGAAAGAKAAYDIYKSWSTEKAQKKAIAEVDTAVTSAIEALGEKYWDNNLLSTALDEASKGVEKLRSDVSLTDVDKIASKVETALEKLLKSEHHAADGTNKLRNIKTARGLILTLEALYQRDDMTSNITNSCNMLVKYLEDPSSSVLIKSQEAALESIRRILVINWNAPIAEKTPDHQLKDGNYRLNIYVTMLDAIYDSKAKQLTGKDPLYLRSVPPSSIEEKVKGFRTALVNAYKYESGLSEGPHKDKHYQPVVDKIGEILEYATAIPELSWSKTAQDELVKRQNNAKRFTEFKKWAENLHYVFQMPEDQLQTCFDSLSINQIEFLGYLPELGDAPVKHLQLLFQKETYTNKEHLNHDLKILLDFFNLGTNVNAEKLEEKKLEKGLFFFRYLNALMEKKVVMENEGTQVSSVYKNHLNEKNRESVLRICKRIVHDVENFSSTPRGYDFFAVPYLPSIPGQALALHRRLTWHINDKDGYVDLYGLKKLVLENSVRNLYPTSEEGSATIRSFLFSGPPGTGKSSFAVALSNHLAVPLFVLKPKMLTIRPHNNTVKHEGKEISLNEFFSNVSKSAPCILLLDEADEILPPRLKDKAQEKDKGNKVEKSAAGTFLSELEKKGDEGLSQKVILIMTTNLPHTETIDASSIDANGYSGDIDAELENHIDYAALREGRVDKRIFTFHKLYNEQQGETLARHFFTPYILSEKITGSVDFVGAGQVLMYYPPATIEKVFEDTARSINGQATQQQMLDELKKHPSLLRFHVDPEIKRQIETTISILVEHLKLKKIEGVLDTKQLAISAKQNGLDKGQITSTITNGTPETLTQENIIAAFEQVRKSAS